VPLKLVLIAVAGVAAWVQVILLCQLIGLDVGLAAPGTWLSLHVLSNALGALCIVKLLDITTYRIEQSVLMMMLVFSLVLFIPVVGIVGSLTALYYGIREGLLRHREPDYWQLTPRTELPYTGPARRLETRVDSRGFIEHLLYSDDEDDLYRKVLAAGNIKSSLSVNALKQAMRHDDERIRLTAYKTLDRKVTQLNRQIQQLEARVSDGGTVESSNSWLQIASNYWELLTLEKGEPVARRQLLAKASAAAIQAVAVLPINRNAHFILGRVSLLQGDNRRANVAFERSRALGMPADKVLPYLAETAYHRHDFARVRSLLSEIDPAARAYPPLSHVAEYWA